MSSIQERLQLKRVPLDTWNIREQLCLASAVVRSGDQNWMSVSRALKTIGEPNRPPDWYSQKSCAAQYGALLEHVETPKRKKSRSEGAVETPQESILKRLTQERILEIQKTLAEVNQQYDQLKAEITEVRNPNTSEERLKEIWAAIEARNRAKERETARRAAWLKERDERRARAERGWRPPIVATTQASNITKIVTPAPPASPLLTSLLKSSPVVTTPQHITHPANVVDTASPSVTAPTLSMLLEKSVTSTSQHESKHAAIEHIKNQLVQIEQQLKANSPVMSPSAAPDIDDIEIKAEDVYAFRDVDLHIPPVSAMHKGIHRTTSMSIHGPSIHGPSIHAPSIHAPSIHAPSLHPPSIHAPSMHAPTIHAASMHAPSIHAASMHAPSMHAPSVHAPKKEEEVIIETIPQNVATKINRQTVKRPEPVPMEIDVVEEIVPDTEETVPVTEIIQHPPPAVTKELSPVTVVKISFPEVRFPTTEIKVIPPEEDNVIMIREEVRLPKPEKIAKASLYLEDDPVPKVVEAIVPVQEEKTIECVTEEVIEEPEPMQIEESAPVDPEPTPEPIVVEREPTPTPIADPEPPAPAEQEVTSYPDDSNTTIEQKLEMMERDDTEQKIVEDIKKNEEPEDTLPIKEILLVEESAKVQESEVKEPETNEKPTIEDHHTETDDDTPMELSREEEKDGKKKRDYSRKKKSDSRTCSGSESAAEASAPDSPSATDADRQHRLWKKSVMLVYSRLCAHKYASLFLRPITDEEAPGYSMVVKRPMDLITIRKNIDNGVTRTTAEFQRDVLLMLSNALVYNSSEHSVYTMAKEMYEEASSQLGMLLAAQAHAGLVEAPPRRKRRADPLQKKPL